MADATDDCAAQYPGLERTLDELEPALAAAWSDYVRAQWERRARATAPRPSDALVRPLLRARLQPVVLGQSRAPSTLAGRRALAMWRWLARAELARDVTVAAAFAAWSAAPSPATLAGLLEARNETARSFGFDDFAALALALDELDAGAVEAAERQLRSELGPQPRGPVLAAPQVSVRLIDLGFPESEATLDVALGAHGVRARTYPVAAPRDVRVYVRAPSGQRGVRVLAHELGHVAYASAVAPELPASLRGASCRAADEALAIYAESAVARVPWRRRVSGLLARAAFERQAYAAPETDLAALWSRLGGARRPPWAPGADVAIDPGVQAAYLVGTALAWQLAAAPVPPAPSALAAVMRCGGSRGWRDLFAELGVSL